MLCLEHNALNVAHIFTEQLHVSDATSQGEAAFECAALIGPRVCEGLVQAIDVAQLHRA